MTPASENTPLAPDQKHGQHWPRLRLFTLLAGCGASLYFGLFRWGFIPSATDLPAALCIPGCAPERPIHGEISQVTKQALSANDQPLSSLLGADFDPQKVSILVEKSAYQLTVFYDLQPVKTYSVVFGSAPVGDKLAQGDRKTPEGIYRIQDLYPHPEWSKFIWLDYPTPPDWREHFQAKLAGDIPLMATIGSEIGIHGTLEGAEALIEARDNWTWGCVSLKNAEVDEIYAAITQGTMIEIVP